MESHKIPWFQSPPTRDHLGVPLETSHVALCGCLGQLTLGIGQHADLALGLTLRGNGKHAPCMW